MGGLLEFVLPLERNEQDRNVGRGDARDARGLAQIFRRETGEFLPGFCSKAYDFFIIKLLCDLYIVEMFEFRNFFLLPFDITGVFELHFDLFIGLHPTIDYLFWKGLERRLIS